MDLKNLHIIVEIGIVGIVAAAAVLGTVRYAIPNLKENLSKHARRLKELEDKLPTLVTLESFEAVTGRLDENCATHRTHCQALVCDRIDTVRDDLKGMDQSRERARNARIFAWDEFKKEIVPRNDFNEYKDEMKGHVTAIEVKMDRQSELLARLDERIKIFIKSNGN